MVARTVQELIELLKLYNPFDMVYMSSIDGAPILSVNEDIVMGVPCDCEGCHKIRLTLPDFFAPKPPSTGVVK